MHMHRMHCRLQILSWIVHFSLMHSQTLIKFLSLSLRSCIDRPFINWNIIKFQIEIKLIGCEWNWKYYRCAPKINSFIKYVCTTNFVCSIKATPHTHSHPQKGGQVRVDGGSVSDSDGGCKHRFAIIKTNLNIVQCAVCIHKCIVSISRCCFAGNRSLALRCIGWSRFGSSLDFIIFLPFDFDWNVQQAKITSYE